MEGFKEFQGKDLDAAIREACEYYAVPREKLEIDIVQDAKSGIFGIVGARKAKIHARRAHVRETVEDILGRGSESLLGASGAGKEDGKKRAKAERGERAAAASAVAETPAAMCAPEATAQAETPAAAKPAVGQTAQAEPTDAAAGIPVDGGEAVPASAGGEKGRPPRENRPPREDRREGRPPRDEKPRRTEKTDETAADDGGEGDARGEERSRRSRGRRRFDRSDRPERSERSERPERGERPERTERAPRALENTEDVDESAQEGFRVVPLTELDAEKLRSVTLDVVGHLISPVVDDMHLQVELADSRVNVMVDCGDASGLLIGREGQTLASLQYLASRIVSRQMDAAVRVHLDAGAYRQRQDEKLRDMALALAERVRASGRSCSTRPLSSYHRRIVHLALQNMEDIQTRSSGEGAMKRVVILRKKQAEKTEKIAD